MISFMGAHSSIISMEGPATTSFLHHRDDELQAPDGAPRPNDDLSVLTDREREVLALAALGLTNDDIAARLFLSPLTVKTHINRAMAKLDVRDRAQLVVIAYQSGLVRPGDTE